MITNERQYRIAKSEATKFEQSLAAARNAEPSPDVHPRVHEAMIEALQSELGLLRQLSTRKRTRLRAIVSLRDSLLRALRYSGSLSSTPSMSERLFVGTKRVYGSVLALGYAGAA